MRATSDIGAAAQAKLMKIPSRLQRTADYLGVKADIERAFSFDFIYDHATTLWQTSMD